MRIEKNFSQITHANEFTFQHKIPQQTKLISLLSINTNNFTPEIYLSPLWNRNVFSYENKFPFMSETRARDEKLKIPSSSSARYQIWLREPEKYWKWKRKIFFHSSRICIIFRCALFQAREEGKEMFSNFSVIKLMEISVDLHSVKSLEIFLIKKFPIIRCLKITLITNHNYSQGGETTSRGVNETSLLTTGWSTFS